MEHKLVQGGEHWLPFARSRIKALRAVGQDYASQRFDMPDGSRVAVRIVNDQEFIEISGGGCSLAMDSGVVDVLSIGELAPGTFLPGSLYECGSALSYNAPFVTTPKSNGFRVNPSKYSTGQISGIVTKNAQFKGRIGESLSFKPGLIDATPATTPPTKILDPADASLWAKKISGVLCPPSIFTGKTRLYVQAMYGLPLYQTEQDGSITTNAPLSIESSTTAAPALWLPAYVDKNDFTLVDGVKTFASYPDILLDTSCGVWLDQTTGEHWLIRLTNGESRIYPLKSNACGEKMRPFLVVKDNPLLPDPQDREHLEAYILAYSRPDVKHMQLGSGGTGDGGSYSMGYGWHWNWTGNTADLVKNEMFMQDLTNAAMRSTHYRLALRKVMLPEPLGGFGLDDMRQVWETPVTVVEGPSDWSVYRTYWTITEPNYSTMILNKVTSQHSLVNVGNAPFYAFYNRDTLTVCRIEVTYTEPEDARTVENDCFGSNGVTTGLTEGDRTVYGAVGGYYSCRVTVGSEQTPLIPFGYVEPFSNRIKVYDKTITGDWGGGFGPIAQYATRQFLSSDDYGNNATTIYLTGTIAEDRSVRNLTFKTNVTSGRVEHWGLITVVVPFYDAEAAYLHHVVRDDTYYDTSTTYTLNNSSGPVGSFLVSSVNDSYSTPTVLTRVSYAQSWGAFAADYHNLVSTDTTPREDELVTSGDTSKLISTAGMLSATFTHLNEFHSNALEEVGAEFGTLTSARSDQPIAIAPGYIDPIGLNGSAPGAPVIVGWV